MATPCLPAFSSRSPLLVLHCAGFALALSFAFESGAEDVIRCKSGRLVNVGMTAAEVRARCGEPKGLASEEVPVRARGAGGGTIVVGTVRHERWTYERGLGQFDALLSFESDKLVRIDLLASR